MSYDRSRPRPRYAPPPPRRQPHSGLGYWVPLFVTGTIALGGLAAWIWSERSEDDDYEHEHGSGGPEKPPRPPAGLGDSGGGVTGVSGDVTGNTPLPPYVGPVPSQSAGPQGVPPLAGGGEAAAYYGTRSGVAEADAYDYTEEETGEESETFFHQARGLMRRTPSPQQVFDHASRGLSAGMVAAGSALGSIMEDPESGHYWEEAVRRDGREEGSRSRSRSRRGEEREREREGGFSDHERWSEEAEESGRRSGVVGAVEAGSERRAEEVRKGTGRPRKSVAIVVSAESHRDGDVDDEDDTVYTEHASILSHLPAHHDPALTDLTILLYSPTLATLPPLTYNPAASLPTDPDLASNLSSSYAHLSTPSPETETEKEPFTPPSQTFAAFYHQALTLVSHPSHILPFTTLGGYVPILRHLAPSTVYLPSTLCGAEGEQLALLKGWVGHAVLVIGDGGAGGLVDSETENETGDESERESKKGEQWWEDKSWVGKGREVEVVDASRVGEDWARRVTGRE